LSLPLPQPSAIFVGMEDAALLICEVNPYNSLLGISYVRRYISIVNEWLFCQTYSVLKSFISVLAFRF